MQLWAEAVSVLAGTDFHKRVLKTARLQAYAYLGDNKRASKSLQKALQRSSEPDAAMQKLEKLLWERLQLKT